MTTRVAIVGTGNAARQHAAALKSMPGFELSAVCGRDPERTREFAREVAPSAGVLTVAEMLSSSHVDAVIIALPANAQPEIAVAAFERGKHVLCEKPLAPNCSDAESIERAWRQSGKVGMVNFCYRLVPEIEAFQAQLQAGVCGAPNLIQADWVLSSRLDPALPFNWKADVHAGGGVLQNFGSHVLDYLFHDTTGVRVLAAHQQTLIPSRTTGLRAVPVTADEVATILFDWPGVCPVVVHLSVVTQPQVGHRLVAYGSDGTLTVSNTSRDSAGGPFALTFSSATPTSPADPVADAPGSAVRGLSLCDLFQRVHARFYEAIHNGGRPYAPDITAGVAVSRLIREIQSVTKHVQAAPTA